MERIDPHSGPRLSMEPQPMGSHGRQQSRGPAMGRGSSPQPGSARQMNINMMHSQGMVRASSPTRAGLCQPPPLSHVCPQLAAVVGPPPQATTPQAALHAQPVGVQTPVKTGYQSTSALPTVNSMGDFHNASPRRSLVHIGSGPNGRSTPRASLPMPGHHPHASPQHPQPGLPLAPAALRADSARRAVSSQPAAMPMSKEFCVVDPDATRRASLVRSRRTSLECSTRVLDPTPREGQLPPRSPVEGMNKENSISNIQREDSIQNHEPKKTVEASTVSVDGIKSSDARGDREPLGECLGTQKTIPVHDAMSPRLPEMLAESQRTVERLVAEVRSARDQLREKDAEILMLRQNSDEASVVVGLSPSTAPRPTSQDTPGQLLRACQKIDALEKELDELRAAKRILQGQKLRLEEQLASQSLEADAQQSRFNEDLERAVAQAREAERAAAAERDSAAAQSSRVQELTQELRLVQQELQAREPPVLSEADLARQQEREEQAEETARRRLQQAQKENQQLRQHLQENKEAMREYEAELSQDRNLANMHNPADYIRGAKQREATLREAGLAEAKLQLEQCKQALRDHVPLASRRAAEGALQGISMVWDPEQRAVPAGP